MDKYLLQGLQTSVTFQSIGQGLSSLHPYTVSTETEKDRGQQTEGQIK